MLSDRLFDRSLQTHAFIISITKWHSHVIFFFGGSMNFTHMPLISLKWALHSFNFTWPLRKQAAYKQATREPMALSPFRGTRQWGPSVPCPMALLPWPADSNQGPHNWETLVLSTESQQLCPPPPKKESLMKIPSIETLRLFIWRISYPHTINLEMLCNPNFMPRYTTCLYIYFFFFFFGGGHLDIRLKIMFPLMKRSYAIISTNILVEIGPDIIDETFDYCCSYLYPPGVLTHVPPFWHSFTVPPMVWHSFTSTVHVAPWVMKNNKIKTLYIHVRLISVVHNRSGVRRIFSREVFWMQASKCLVHIWPAMGLRSPYPLSVRPPRGLRAEAGCGCEIFVWIHGLCSLYNFA